MPPILSCIILVGLSVFGAFSLHVFTAKNGMGEQIESYSDKRLLPDGVTTYSESFVGWAPVDSLFRTLLSFFWPVTSGDSPALFSVGFLFAGQAVPVWALTMLEGRRMGNKGRAVAFTTVYGLMMQAGGCAVMGPLFLCLHLLTSTTVTNPTVLDLTIDEASITAVPFALVIGYILPTVLMILPAPSWLATTSKINAILIWQVFPALCWSWSLVWQALWPNINYGKMSPGIKARTIQLPATRGVVTFAMVLGVAAHAAVCTLSFSAYFFPTIYATGVADDLHPANIFVPPNPFSDVKISSLEQGAQWLLQWDYLISSAAYLLWAVTLKSAAKKRNGRAGDKYSPQGLMETALGGVLEVLLKTIVLGPMAAALLYVWERDEMVLDGTGEETRQAEKKLL